MNHALLKSVIYDQHEFIRDFQIVPRNYESVSYTHLTLPTIYSV